MVNNFSLKKSIEDFWDINKNFIRKKNPKT